MACHAGPQVNQQPAENADGEPPFERHDPDATASFDSSSSGDDGSRSSGSSGSGVDEPVTGAAVTSDSATPPESSSGAEEAADGEGEALMSADVSLGKRETPLADKWLVQMRKLRRRHAEAAGPRQPGVNLFPCLQALGEVPPHEIAVHSGAVLEHLDWVVDEGASEVREIPAIAVGLGKMLEEQAQLSEAFLEQPERRERVTALVVAGCAQAETFASPRRLTHACFSQLLLGIFDASFWPALETRGIDAALADTSTEAEAAALLASLAKYAGATAIARTHGQADVPPPSAEFWQGTIIAGVEQRVASLQAGSAARFLLGCGGLQRGHPGSDWLPAGRARDTILAWSAHVLPELKDDPHTATMALFGAARVVQPLPDAMHFAAVQLATAALPQMGLFDVCSCIVSLGMIRPPVSEQLAEAVQAAVTRASPHLPPLMAADVVVAIARLGLPLEEPFRRNVLDMLSRTVLDTDANRLGHLIGALGHLGGPISDSLRADLVVAATRAEPQMRAPAAAAALGGATEQALGIQGDLLDTLLARGTEAAEEASAHMHIVCDVFCAVTQLLKPPSAPLMASMQRVAPDLSPQRTAQVLAALESAGAAAPPQLAEPLVAAAERWAQAQGVRLPAAALQQARLPLSDALQRMLAELEADEDDTS